MHRLEHRKLNHVGTLGDIVIYDSHNLQLKGLYLR